jgi:hypothetical protein
MMIILLLFVGLGVDVGNLMGKKAKLQSAVDSAALSAAQLLGDASATTSTIQIKAYQILEANGVPSNTLAVRQVDVITTTSQVHIHADQMVDTFFMRLVPMWRQVDVTADATADLNSYAELNIKPYGIPGVVNELNISVWGPNSWRSGGDAYSPLNNPPGAAVNTEHAKMPYGYLYRIDVPPAFPDTHMLVQIFDPDSYNRPDAPPTPYTPIPTATFCPFPCAVSTATPYASPTFYPNDGRYTWCPYGDNTGLCSTWLTNVAPPAIPGVVQRYNTGLKLGAFPLTTTPIPTVFDNTRRAAFWRVDEERHAYNDPSNTINPGGTEWNDAWMDTTTYSLWHFDPHITSAFADPSTLSDQAGGAPLSVYTSTAGTSFTDLAWYQPPGFDVALVDPSNPSCNFNNSHDCFQRESDGSFYFYIYVSTSAGSSENNFDLRVGPRNNNYTNGYNCTSLSNPNTNACFANTQYMLESLGTSQADWDNGGNSPAVVFAKRAMSLNLDTGDHFPMLFTQVNKNAAGQTLAIRHFDQDCTGGCGPSHTMQYQMQLCVSNGSSYTPCLPTSSDGCFGNLSGTNGVGFVGPNNGWLCPDGYDNGCPGGWTQPTDKVLLPVEGTADYTTFFGPNGECGSSWLRLQSDPSYTQDTTVWEMPFARPRLIR